MPKFTPGPWKVFPGDYPGIEADRISIVVYGDGEADACGVRGSPEERKANARLIAAAPNLYSVLMRLVAELPQHRDWLDPVLESEVRAILSEIASEPSFQVPKGEDEE